MKKIILFIIINLFLLTSSYSIDNRQDSINHDLYSFLVSQGDMHIEQIPEFGCDNYGKYLAIFDILSKTDIPNFTDIPFGIYKFNYSGYADGGYYVLIKHKESYKIYNQTSLSLIIGELIKIRKTNPDLIDNELFNAYIEEIIDDHLGIYDDRMIIVQTIGNIKYYR
jgi:hypothetical protein